MWLAWSVISPDLNRLAAQYACRALAGLTQPAFRRDFCWMIAMSRANRFMRRKLSTKRVAGDRCRNLEH